MLTATSAISLQLHSSLFAITSSLIRVAQIKQWEASTHSVAWHQTLYVSLALLLASTAAC